ncbi:MAG: hypothetical protein B6U89_04865 [Desulfurococcales archaeon ex4484_58]|nr:MAG: hypothetical protein B6U89_04865 [Desulfurococcales archaeon ex4484_58]
MIWELIQRYTYYILLLVIILFADHIIDRRLMISRVLRIVAFASPWFILPVIGFEFKLLNIVFILLATLGSIIISFYSEGYLKILFGKISSLQMIIDITLLFIIIFFTTQNLIEFVIIWIIVELMGSLLVLLERGMRNYNVVMKYLLVCVTAGDISLFLLLALTAMKIGFDQTLIVSLEELKNLNLTLNPLLTILALIGFTTKLAQIPLHFWLVDTYTETSSPGTAIFSGLMSKMAIYAILNIYSLLNLDITIYTYMLLIQGIITTIYGFLLTTLHSDIKKIMSYSSLGHYGVMTMIASLIPYNNIFYTLLLLYVLYHGFLKIQAFLNVSTIEILTNTRDIYRLGYLAQVARKVYSYSIITFLSLIGIPPTLGFYAKFALLVSLFMLFNQVPLISLIIIICIGFASVFSVIYSIKYISTYTSSYRSKPIRTTIPLTNTQYWSEICSAVSAVILPLMFLFIGVNTFIDRIAFIVYVLSILSMFLTYIIYRKYAPRETKIWVGGIEV